MSARPAAVRVRSHKGPPGSALAEFDLAVDADQALGNHRLGLAAVNDPAGQLQDLRQVDLALTDAQLLAFFTFMFKYGSTPFTMSNGPALFSTWEAQPESWQFAADRTILMSILSQLSQL